MTDRALPRACKAAIIGLAGTRMNDEEKRLLTEHTPAGIILFARNCETPDQLLKLCAEAREAAGWHLPVLIDQEGGRVSRLKPPHWPAFPAAATFGAWYERDQEHALATCRANARLLGAICRDVGIDINCAPVLDLPARDSDPIIGDRAFSVDIEAMIALARAQCEGFRDVGVVPVIKHIPGHGRADADSHLALPIVEASMDELEATDFRPFVALADMPIAMTAHVAYLALDGDNPASTSSRIIRDIIRAKMAYDGLLISDDLSMQALTGSIEERALACLDAGCDIALHCNGDIKESRAVLAAAPTMAGPARERMLRICQWDVNCDKIETIAELTHRRDVWLQGSRSNSTIS